MGYLVTRSANGNTVSYSGTPYVNPAAGTHRLCLQTGAQKGDVVRYGLTTHTSASQYCGMRVCVDGKAARIGRSSRYSCGTRSGSQSLRNNTAFSINGDYANASNSRTSSSRYTTGSGTTTSSRESEYRTTLVTTSSRLSLYSSASGTRSVQGGDQYSNEGMSTNLSTSYMSSGGNPGNGTSYAAGGLWTSSWTGALSTYAGSANSTLATSSWVSQRHYQSAVISYTYRSSTAKGTGAYANRTTLSRYTSSCKYHTHRYDSYLTMASASYRTSQYTASQKETLSTRSSGYTTTTYAYATSHWTDYYKTASSRAYTTSHNFNI